MHIIDTIALLKQDVSGRASILNTLKINWIIETKRGLFKAIR